MPADDVVPLANVENPIRDAVPLVLVEDHKFEIDKTQRFSSRSS